MRELSVDTTGSRLTELDGLRGVAVLMVLVWHFVGALINVDMGGWAKGTYRVFILGRTGVDLFFVLSGFLITRIFLSKTSSGVRFLSVFYIKRVLRIFPPYLLLVGIFWTVVLLGVSNSVFSGETPFWRHLTFTQNFWMSETASWGPAGISVSWSIAIEEHYYLFFPLFALVLPQRLLPGGLMCIAAASILCRGLMYRYSPENAYLSYVMTFSRLDGLAVGGLVAWAFSNNTVRNCLVENELKLRKYLWVLISVIPLFAISTKFNLAKTMFYWGHTYLTLLYALVITLVLLNAGSDHTKWLRTTVLSFFGRISYSVYLFHPLILASCFLLTQRIERINNWTDAGIAALAFASTVLFCTALYRWYENPILQYGKRWKY